MYRPHPLCTMVLTFGALALGGCGEGTAPTEERRQFLASGLGSWTPRAPMPTPRSSLASAMIPNASHQPILYAIGGETSTTFAARRVEAYNFVTNTWTKKADLPLGRSVTSMTQVINGKIYLAGGFNSSHLATNTLYVYDPATNTWIRKASLPVKAAAGTSGVIDGKLYVLVSDCFGCEAIPARRLYRYDPSSDAWTRRADCPRVHQSPAGNVIGGKLYVAGGTDENEVPLTSLDVYDAATNSWTAKAPLPQARIAAPAAVLANNLYVLGGGEGWDSTMVAYDPATNTWANKAPMTAPWEGPAARTVTYAGISHILEVGGYGRDGQPSGNLDMYTP